MKEEIVELLEKKYAFFNHPRFIEHDPIQIPHLFTKLQDREIMGFWVAMLSWGQRTTILNNAKKLIYMMDGAPHDFILNHKEVDLKRFESFTHRTFQSTDALYFLRFFKRHYTSQNSLETAFVSNHVTDELNTTKAINDFYTYFFDDVWAPERTKKHVSTPQKNSACKRICMFLRWMVRDDKKGVDFGLWKKIKPQQLICPLDVHSQRTAEKLGLIVPGLANWKKAVELTEELKKIDPMDPVKFDFALYGMGIEEKNNMEIIVQDAKASSEKKVILHNPQTGEKVVILPEIGAALLELELICDHILIPIVDLPGEKSIRENDLYPSALLAPWVNRVRNGNYSFEGRNYQLPINEQNLGNAIHGFLARKPFEVFEKKCTHELAEVSFIHNYTGDFPGYPFPFIFTLTYRLSSKGILNVNFNCKNTGEKNMPFACGWHPYFKIANAEIRHLEIKFSPTLKYISDAQMIPMSEEIVSFPMPVRFSETTLDNVFKLESQSVHLTELTDTQSKTSLFLKQNSAEFPYLVVFAPSSENCVAIEPMTGNTDAFNTGDGLKVLSPNEDFASLVEIWVDKAKI